MEMEMEEEVYGDEKKKALEQLLKQMYEKIVAGHGDSTVALEGEEKPGEGLMEELADEAPLGGTEEEIGAMGDDDDSSEEPEVRKMMKQFMGEKMAMQPKGKTAKVMIKSVSAKPLMKMKKKPY